MEKKQVKTIERGGFKAEIYEAESCKFQVQYFGPTGRDFGTKNHVANTWEAFAPEVESTLDGLREKYPVAQDVTNNVQGEQSNWKDGELPDSMKATWEEKENLRPTVQGDIDGIVSQGGLRYTKDKRRRRLDELDGEPE